MSRDDDKRDEALSALNGRYYALAGDLAPALLSFIRANRAEIVLGSSRDIGAR
jgi:hypothetical protein